MVAVAMAFKRSTAFSAIIRVGALVLQEVIHGKFRYPDGGDKSHQLLDLVAALRIVEGDRAVLLGEVLALPCRR